MKRSLAVALALLAPHLLEEALLGMHDDPVIVAAYAPIAHLGARHAAYLVFQTTLAVGLLATLLIALGGAAGRLAMGVLSVALLAEAHHAVRALWTWSPNVGLATSLPLPVFGALIASRVVRGARSRACFTP